MNKKSKDLKVHNVCAIVTIVGAEGRTFAGNVMPDKATG